MPGPPDAARLSVHSVGAEVARGVPTKLSHCTSGGRDPHAREAFKSRDPIAKFSVEIPAYERPVIRVYGFSKKLSRSRSAASGCRIEGSLAQSRKILEVNP